MVIAEPLRYQLRFGTGTLVDMGPVLLWWSVVALLGASADGSADCKSVEERSKSGDRKVVCSNMELHQVFPADSLPNRTVTL